MPQTLRSLLSSSTPEARAAIRRAWLRRGALALAAVLAALALYTVFWFFAAGTFREGVEAWIAARRAQGDSVGYERFAIGGFPFLVRAQFERPAFERLGAERSGVPFAWRGERLIAVIRPWAPGHVRLEAVGEQRLRFGRAVKELAFRAEALAADLAFAEGEPETGTADARRLTLSADGWPASLGVAKASLTARRGHPEPGDHRASALDLALAAEGLSIPAGDALPLGNDVASLRLEASVRGAIPEIPWPKLLAVWRDAGGTLEATDVTLAYGPLTLEANGTAALDETMQPIAAFAARIRGFFELIDGLAARGLVRRGAATTAKLVLGAIARRPEDGGPPVLSVSISLQDRKLYVGPVAIAELPEIDWGDRGP